MRLRQPHAPSCLIVLLLFSSLLEWGCAQEPPAEKKGAPATTSMATSSAKSPSAATTTTTTATSSSPPARPLYYQRAIVAKDLEGRTLRELSLLRNTIYARVGNVFRRPWLHAHFSRFEWYVPKKNWDASKLSELDKRNAKTIGEFDAALTRAQLEKMRDRVLARANKPLPHDDVERSLLSQRLGQYLGHDPTRATALEDHRRLDQLVAVKDLATFSRRDLRILRNMVYARRGRRFASKVVRAYFKAAAWYRPRADYQDALLTPIDRKNIAIIRSVEDELGGPVHENPLFDPKNVPDGWFVMA